MGPWTPDTPPSFPSFPSPRPDALRPLFAFPPRAFCNAFLPGAGCEEAVASSQAVLLALWASPEPLLVLAAGWAPCLHPKPIGSRGAAARDAQRAEGSNRERGWEGGEGVDADTSCAIKKKTNNQKTTKKTQNPSKTNQHQTPSPIGELAAAGSGLLGGAWAGAIARLGTRQRIQIDPC